MRGVAPGRFSLNDCSHGPMARFLPTTDGSKSRGYSNLCFICVHLWLICLCMTPEVRVRFAPSPTGYLHIGGARTALFNWLFARHHDGKFILRIEDTDRTRNTEEAAAAIYEGLRWLGLDWDEGPHVGGGEDHRSNTPKHIELYRALGATPPHFAHIPLILNRDGSKMSKRDEGARVATYIEQGYVPEAVRNYLCLLGWSPKDNREKIDIDEVAKLFELEKINRRNAAFDLDKCFWLNGQYIAQMSLDRFIELARPFLEKADIDVSDKNYLRGVLSIVKEKIKLLSDVSEWTRYFFIEDYEF